MIPFSAAWLCSAHYELRYKIDLRNASQDCTYSRRKSKGDILRLKSQSKFLDIILPCRGGWPTRAHAGSPYLIMWLIFWIVYCIRVLLLKRTGITSIPLTERQALIKFPKRRTQEILQCTVYLKWCNLTYNPIFVMPPSALVSPTLGNPRKFIVPHLTIKKKFNGHSLTSMILFLPFLSCSWPGVAFPPSPGPAAASTRCG